MVVQFTFDQRNKEQEEEQKNSGDNCGHYDCHYGCQRSVVVGQRWRQLVENDDDGF